MTRSQKKLERKTRKAKIRAAQYAASAARKNQKGKAVADRPVKIEGYHSMKLHARRDQKRAEAFARQDAWEKLTTKQKISSLKKRNKVNGGESKKQLLKLLELSFEMESAGEKKD